MHAAKGFLNNMHKHSVACIIQKLDEMSYLLSVTVFQTVRIHHVPLLQTCDETLIQSTWKFWLGLSLIIKMMFFC